MYRSSTSCLGLAAVLVLGCGAPAELDESLFPDSYTNDDQAGSGGGVAPPMGGAGALPPVGGMPPVGGAPPVGGGGTAPVGGGGVPAPIGGGAGGTDMAAGGGGDAPSAGGCPSDMTVLFNRGIDQGGCAGSGCHVPEGIVPDLVSPDPLSRLLNVVSTCNGLPYIGATQENSFLWLKVTTPPDGCGLTMPFFAPNALTAEDEACIEQWVAENVGG